LFSLYFFFLNINVAQKLKFVLKEGKNERKNHVCFILMFV
jgi:hypothetical protein